MRSSRPKAFLFVLLVLTASATASGFAAEEKPWTEQFLSEFSGIKTRLADVEKAQQDILAQKDKILEELDRLRVWVRHSGSKK